MLSDRTHGSPLGWQPNMNATNENDPFDYFVGPSKTDLFFALPAILDVFGRSLELMPTVFGVNSLENEHKPIADKLLARMQELP